MAVTSTGTRLYYVVPELKDTSADLTRWTPAECGEILEPGDITGPTISRSEINVTSHTTPQRSSDYLPGRTDFGTCTFTIFYNPDDESHNYLIDAQIDQDNYDDSEIFIIRHRLRRGEPAVGTIRFKAWIQNNNHAFPVDGAQSLDLTLRIIEAPVRVRPDSAWQGTPNLHS